MMVTGIKNSTHWLFILTSLYMLKARVRECPMVKAVISINTCFQLLTM